MIEPEDQLARFAHGLRFEQLPPDAVRLVKRLLIAVSGTGVAGAEEDGILALRQFLVARGGAPEARVIVHGDRLPAASAAMLNAAMCRALDFCDAMAPGPHIGSALIPAAFAAAELRGGCDGRRFIAALAAGAELGSRFNLTEAQYDGFDPTGICVNFAAAGAAAVLLGLEPPAIRQALGLAFNRCGGSFQSHVDGSLGVRLTQGWVAEAGVACAQFAQLGLGGPRHFLTGIYGYPHLYGRDRLAPTEVVEGLGTDWRLHRVVFKKYPSCGVTQGATELTLRLMAEHGLAPEAVASAEVRLPPYAHRLVGHRFHMGENPRVDAQFSAQYTVANAIVRGVARLSHFTIDAIRDPAVLAMVERVRTVADPAMDARGHSSVDVAIDTTDGRRFALALDVAPGFPGNGLTDAEHFQRFDDCMAYAPRALAADRARAWLDAIDSLEDVDDVRQLLPLLVVEAG
ncbi:MAG: MmgE/PrpD family protein [Burkholderiaceae bacterium]|nr:MmgE/PrpD family protein [Burkholderiaceae bacterium]